MPHTAQLTWPLVNCSHLYSVSVVEQRFVIEVYDEFVTSGNSVVLRCHIPAFMRDLLDIVAWVEGSSNYILPEHHPNAGNEYDQCDQFCVLDLALVLIARKAQSVCSS